MIEGVIMAAVVANKQVDLMDNFGVQKMLKGMLGSNTYSLILLITKKGYCIVDALRDEPLWPIADSSAFICSDRLLGSPEFVRLLKKLISGGNNHICVFDDSTCYGRKLRDVCSRIHDICNEHSLSVAIDVKVIVKYAEFDAGKFKNEMHVDDFESVIECHELSCVREHAIATIKLLYEKRCLIAVGAPKAHKASCDDLEALCDQMQMEESNDRPTAFLGNWGISFRERYFNVNELCKRFGDKLGGFISNASIEMYIYDDLELGIVSRASLSRITLDDLNRAIDGLWDAYCHEKNDTHYCDLIGAAETLKYEWLNYILSMLVFYDAFEKDMCRLFDFDTKYLEDHYGQAASSIIKSIVEAMNNDYVSVKRNLKFLFNSMKTNDEIVSLMDKPSEEMLGYVFGYMPNEEKIIPNYYNLQSQLEIYANDVKFKELYKNETYECADVSVYSLINFFKAPDTGVTETRKEFVHAQVDGRISVGPKYVHNNGNPYIEKFPKVGEANIPLMCAPVVEMEGEMFLDLRSILGDKHL